MDRVKDSIQKYKHAADYILNHIILMLQTKHKYVFSEACTTNLDMYFKYLSKIRLLEEHQKLTDNI